MKQYIKYYSIHLLQCEVVPIGHMPHFKLKCKGFFGQMKGHNSRSEKVVKVEISLTL